MAVISGTEKEKLINLFEQRGVKFYHACQWVDFKTYCFLGGVPSRNLMETNGHKFTPFDTDERDKENEVWRHVFGNLADSGVQFAKMGTNEKLVATPNVFGPILLVFKPTILNYVEDVAIALRSAGGQNFNRNEESLSTVEEVNRLFKYEDINDVDFDQEKAYFKFSDDLINEFPGRSEGATPEVSLLVNGELLPFEYLSNIVVDKIYVSENYLPYHVFEKLKEFEISCSVEERKYIAGREKLISDLVKASVESLNYEDIKKEMKELREWIDRIATNDRLFFFFKRFVKYWENGTINELVKETKFEYGIFELPPSLK